MGGAKGGGRGGGVVVLWWLLLELRSFIIVLAAIIAIIALQLWENTIVMGLLMLLVVVYYLTVASQVPCVHMDSTGADRHTLAAAIPSLHKRYFPSPMLVHYFFNTFYLWFGRPRIQSEKMIFEEEFVPQLFSDGEQGVLHWRLSRTAPVVTTATDAQTPGVIVIFFHGVSGGTTGKYVQYIAQGINRKGWHFVVPIRRGCGDKGTITMPKHYAYGDYDDTHKYIEYISNKMPRHLLIGVGISAGANVLANYLGRVGSSSRICGGICVNNGFHWGAGNSVSLRERPFWNYLLTHFMKTEIFEKHADVLMSSPNSPVDPSFKVDQITNLLEYDTHITMRMHGYNDAIKFYDEQSSLDRIPGIRIPTIFVNSLDDPMACRRLIPFQALTHNANTLLVTTARGGHMGFATGLWPFRECYTWLENFFLEGVEALVDVALRKKGKWNC